MIVKCLIIKKRLMLLLSLKRRRTDTTFKSQLDVQGMKKRPVTAVLLTIRSMNVSFRKQLILQLRLPLWAAVQIKAIIWQFSLDKMRSFGFICLTVLHNSFCLWLCQWCFRWISFLWQKCQVAWWLELQNWRTEFGNWACFHFTLIPSTKVELNSCTLP